jgi:hypothetical protein
MSWRLRLLIVALAMLPMSIVGYSVGDPLLGIWPPVERYQFSGPAGGPGASEAPWVLRLARIVVSPAIEPASGPLTKLHGSLYQYHSSEPRGRVELMMTTHGWELRVSKLHPRWADLGPATVRLVCTDRWLLSQRRWYVIQGGSFDGAMLVVVERWRDFLLMSRGYAAWKYGDLCGRTDWLR